MAAAASDFYFAGTTYYGTTPSFFSVVASTSSGSTGAPGKCTALLFDVTNNKPIATINCESYNSNRNVFSTTSFTNVPVYPAIWELQVVGKAMGGANTSSTLYSSYVRLT